jgi:hypothetical protein
MTRAVNEGGLLSWPTVVGIRKLEQRITVGSLSRCEREQLGKHLLENYPETARELSELQADPIVRELKRAFNATILLNENVLPEDLLTNLNRR